MLRRAAQRFEARRRRWKCAPRFGNTAVVHQSLFFSTEDTLDDDQRALDRRGQWREELLEEEISAEEHGENAENKPAHLEAKAARLREDAIAAEDAAETARKRIERHRRQRTRELENRAKELREEAKDLDRRAPRSETTTTRRRRFEGRRSTLEEETLAAFLEMEREARASERTARDERRGDETDRETDL